MMEYGITEQMLSKVKEFINSRNTQDRISRTELFKALYGDEQWAVEASKESHPLDRCIFMLVKCGFFLRPTIWSGIWNKTKDIPAELTVQDLVNMFEDLQDED